MNKPLNTRLMTISVALVFVAVACTQSGRPASDSSTLTGNPIGPGGVSPDKATDQEVLSATIEFGRDGLGSPFPPDSGHDASTNSRDSLFPREVVIDKGGTVTFLMGASGVHEVAIYQPGTESGDINTSLLDAPAPTCPPVPTINDPNHRIAIVSDQGCEGGSQAPTWTFTTPGRYLVICTFLPHFQMGMYGWVTVRDR